MKRFYGIRFQGAAAVALLFGVAGCGGDGRSPSIDVLGSYFPAWFVCVIVGLGLAVIVRALLLAAKIPPAWPALVYPCLVVIFALATWLLFYRV